MAEEGLTREEAYIIHQERKDLEILRKKAGLVEKEKTKEKGETEEAITPEQMEMAKQEPSDQLQEFHNGTKKQRRTIKEILLEDQKTKEDGPNSDNQSFARR